MDSSRNQNTFLVVAFGIAFGAVSLWFAQFVWQRVQEHDANPRRASVKNQLMRRKSAAMDEALQAIIRGDLARVNTAAVKMRQAAGKIDGFLSTPVYDQHGEDFYAALDELLAASGEQDRDGSKEAILKLEKSCIECHYLIQQPE